MKKIVIEGSIVLKIKDLYFRVDTITPTDDNQYVFDCTELKSAKRTILPVTMSGLYNALDKAAYVERGS